MTKLVFPYPVLGVEGDYQGSTYDCDFDVETIDGDDELVVVHRVHDCPDITAAIQNGSAVCTIRVQSCSNPFFRRTCTGNPTEAMVKCRIPAYEIGSHEFNVTARVVAIHAVTIQHAGATFTLAPGSALAHAEYPRVRICQQETTPLVRAFPSTRTHAAVRLNHPEFLQLELPQARFDLLSQSLRPLVDAPTGAPLLQLAATIEALAHLRYGDTPEEASWAALIRQRATDRGVIEDLDRESTRSLLELAEIILDEPLARAIEYMHAQSASARNADHAD